jgi:POT family proton-dependent oligopeptide transporter
VSRGERFPPQIKFIIGNEGCERFSFYGMRSILTVYMAGYLGLPDHVAAANYHLFVMACYLTPLAGGWLADRFFGRYRVIFWLSLGYVAGHAVIALFESRAGLYVGLALIAAGSGGIKPCVSAFVGDQFHAGQSKLVEKVYALFYWSVNLGSFSSTLLIPVLLARYGPRVAFALPGLLMAISLLVFVAGRRRYRYVPPTGPNPHGFLRVTLSRFAGNEERHPPEAVAGAAAAWRVMGVFAALLGFWALFDQHGSSWVIQARAMNLSVGGWKLQPSQLAALNPIMVLGLIPLLTGLVFPWLERRGLRPTPLRRIGAGMFVTTLSFVCAAVVQLSLDRGGHPHALWQLVQYLFLTVGEVLVSVTALEFAYTQAPRSMKSTVMSLWFLTIAAGNLLTAWVSELNRFQGAAYFAFFAALVFACAVAFTLVARRYRSVEFQAA